MSTAEGRGERPEVAQRAPAELTSAAQDAAVLLGYIDATGHVRFVNGRQQEWFGRPSDATIGRHLRDVLGASVYDAIRPHVEAALSGRSTSFSHAAEVAGRNSSLAVSLSPDRDAQGAVRGCTVTVVVLTDERVADRPGADGDAERAHESLCEREARLSAILDSAVDGIIAIDELGNIQSLNPAAERLFGYTERELLGRNVNLLMPSPYRDEHDGYLAAYLGTSQARIIGIGREVEARRKDGEVFPIHLSVGEARLGSRRIFTGIIHDLTERNRLQDQLAQSQKMEALGRLAGGVAHDFNNILQTVLARSVSLSRRLPKGHRAQREVVEIRKAGRRAAALTGQLLAVSRAQVLNARVVDLNEILSDTVGMLRRALGEELELVMDLHPDPVFVKVDSDRMVQVLLNLAVNARDAMPGGGRVAIETRTVAKGPAEHMGAALLTVRDTGSGMDEATQARIFEPYFTTKGEKGTGLGLSTVYGIVQQSAGSIRVESRPGEGTSFIIRLPRAESRPVTAAAPPRPPSRRKRGGRVLLVEDELSARRALEELLRDEGHTVLSAGNGIDAEKIWKQTNEPIDVVVTDTVMPRMSGPELVRRLKESHPDVHVIFMSGHTRETVVEHGGVGTGTTFLQKPFEVEVLLAKVRELLAGGGGSAPARSRSRSRGRNRR
jgi:PAS domain S-box-containing protein